MFLFFITPNNDTSNVSVISKVDSIVKTQNVRLDKALEEYINTTQNNTTFTSESLTNVINANNNIIQFLENEKLE
jgi:hypothetical protein